MGGKILILIMIWSTIHLQFCYNSKLQCFGTLAYNLVYNSGCDPHTIPNYNVSALWFMIWFTILAMILIQFPFCIYD